MAHRITKVKTYLCIASYNTVKANTVGILFENYL